MHIYYDHAVGKVEKNDLQISRILAENVTAEQEPMALNKGFLLVTENPVPIWENTRSTRIDMRASDFGATALSVEAIHQPGARRLEAYTDLYARFLASRGFAAIPTDMEFMGRDWVIEYWDGDTLVGFSKVRHYTRAVELQLHCNVVEDRSFGFQTLLYELSTFRHHPYVYLGPGYEVSSIYKAKVEGFEWWTGREWSHDRSEFVRRCKADTSFSL